MLGVDSAALTLHYFLFFLSATSVAGGGRGTYLWVFHATVISSNLIQPSSFSLVCSSHIGACRLRKPHVPVCVGVKESRERKGDGGRHGF